VTGDTNDVAVLRSSEILSLQLKHHWLMLLTASSGSHSPCIRTGLSVTNYVNCPAVSQISLSAKKRYRKKSEKLIKC